MGVCVSAEDWGVHQGPLDDDPFAKSAWHGAATFDGVYRAEYRAVVRLAAVLTGRWAVAEELAQEAFLALYTRWDQVQVYERPDLWVRRVVVNRAVSVRRRWLTE